MILSEDEDVIKEITRNTLKSIPERYKWLMAMGEFNDAVALLFQETLLATEKYIMEHYTLEEKKNEC